MTSDVEATVDRISMLPRSIIDLIVDRLPVHDAARTSVLSKTWKSIWVNHPHLVFDERFLTQLAHGKSKQAKLRTVTKTISTILLLHSGPIVKFHLFIPDDLPLNDQYQDLDIWIKHISNNGVRILEFLNELPVAYKLPSNLYSCLGLTELKLNNCILHPPLKFGGFPNLKSVKLLDVTIDADMSFGLQLEKLNLERCKGIEHLGCQFKCNNNLTLLMIDECGPIDWQWFEFTHKVKEFCLMYECEGCINEKAINFDKLVDNMPEISILHLDGYFLELLEPGAANSWKLTTAMENLNFLGLYDIEFHRLLQIQSVLCLIQSSPNLQYLYIRVGKPSENSSVVMESMAVVEQYFQLPNITDMILDKLQTVKIIFMAGSKAELQLIKLLLASSPLLKLMKLKYDHTKLFLLSDPEEKFRISQELLQFTRASAVARIILK